MLKDGEAGPSLSASASGDRQSPLTRVDALISDVNALTFNDLVAARALKERALVLIRHLSAGDTRLYMSVAKGAIFNDLPSVVLESDAVRIRAAWQRSKEIALAALTALREGVALQMHSANAGPTVPTIGFEALLHADVIRHALKHFRDENYRNAVSDAMLVLTEHIRTRTGLVSDGEALVVDAFKPSGPRLAFTQRRTPSEMDEHRGFFQICQGAFAGVRNPKVHVLSSDLDAVKAAQYLVFISLLVRRVDEAHATSATS